MADAFRRELTRARMSSADERVVISAIPLRHDRYSLDECELRSSRHRLVIVGREEDFPTYDASSAPLVP